MSLGSQHPRARWRSLDEQRGGGRERRPPRDTTQQFSAPHDAIAAVFIRRWEPRRVRVANHVSLDGPLNFRAVGGMAAGPGRRVRPAHLYRSDSLASLTDDDVAHLFGMLRVEAVIDLRSDLEVDQLGQARVAAGVALVRIGMFDPQTTGGRLDELGFASIADAYRTLVDKESEAIAAAVSALAAASRQPVVVMCTAGKDRTGVLVALVLSVLGVSRDDIVADYAASAHAIPAMRARWQPLVEARLGPGAKLPEEMMRADPSDVDALLDQLVRQHGSVERYLQGAGVSDVALQRLRLHLVC